MKSKRKSHAVSRASQLKVPAVRRRRLEDILDRIKEKTIATRPEIQLLGDRVLVRMDTAETQRNGLWLPGKVQRDDEAFYAGTVVACGPGDHDKWGRFHPVSVVPGDRVMVYWFAVEDGKGHGGPRGPLSGSSREAGHRWNSQHEVFVRESDIAVVVDA